MLNFNLNRGKLKLTAIIATYYIIKIKEYNIEELIPIPVLKYVPLMWPPSNNVGMESKRRGNGMVHNISIISGKLIH